MFGIAGTAELSTFCPGTGTWNRLQDGIDRARQAMSLTQDHTEPFGVLRTSDKKEEPSFASKGVLG